MNTLLLPILQDNFYKTNFSSETETLDAIGYYG